MSQSRPKKLVLSHSYKVYKKGMNKKHEGGLGDQNAQSEEGGKKRNVRTDGGAQGGMEETQEEKGQWNVWVNKL